MLKRYNNLRFYICNIIIRSICHLKTLGDYTFFIQKFCIFLLFYIDLKAGEW